MSWIGITALAGVLIIFFALIATYMRGYREGFKEGEESGLVLKSLEALKPSEEIK